MILNKKTISDIKELIESQRKSIALITALSVAGAGVTVAESIKGQDTKDYGNQFQYEVLKEPVKEYVETVDNVLVFAMNITTENPSKENITIDVASVGDTNNDNQVIDIDNMTAEEKDEFLRQTYVLK